MSPQNRAAYITAPKTHPFTVKDAPFPSPAAHEVVVRAHAVAINPVDWKIQDYDFFVESYPFILGTDAAGTIETVGSSVTSFQPGDRVIAHMDGLGTHDIANNAYQTYVKTNATLVAKLPENVSYTDGVVLPLALSTASAGLFEKDFLGLPLPVAGKKAEDTGKVVLVWGGSSSVGATAVQLATAAGVKVATTASAHNHQFVRDLGAEFVFDHTKDGVVDEIVAALKGKGEFAGVYDAISVEDTLKKSSQVAAALAGKKFVATVLPPPEGSIADGVSANGVFAVSIASNEVGPAVWGKFVTQALKDGSLKTKPDALVVGKGLEKIQEGVDKNKAGVSAKKIVVELD